MEASAQSGLPILSRYSKPQKPIEILQEIERKCFSIKFLIKEKQKIIGQVRLYLMYNELQSRPFGLMDDLFVVEEFRSNGWGRKLVDSHCFANFGRQ